MKTLFDLVSFLQESGRLRTPIIIQAFETIDRKHFVRESEKEQAYDDTALPIGYGATISQPSTVALLLEWLQPKRGDRILEIGTGSGYVAALLARIVGKNGKVVTVEYLEQLSELAQRNLSHYRFGNIKLVVGDGKNGFPERSPYNGIVSGASGASIPEPWKKQVSIDGRIVAPVRSDIVVLDKQNEDEFKKEVHTGFAFVPLQ